MNQRVDPKVFASVIAIVLCVAVLYAYQVYTAPSVRPAYAAKKGPVNPHDGGPTEADLQKMRAYNASHPGASSSIK